MRWIINSFEKTFMSIYLHSQALYRFKTGVFTIICSDWSWIVGILLGKLLEADGNTVSLIFFESTVTWESPAALQQIKYSVSKKAIIRTEIQSFRQFSDWDCIQIILNLKVNRDLELSRTKLHNTPAFCQRIESALEKLKFMLNLFANEVPMMEKKIKGYCHYIRPSILFEPERFKRLQNVSTISWVGTVVKKSFISSNNYLTLISLSNNLI